MDKKLLFMCTGNSVRSQIAEGFARRFSDERVQVLSAGVVATEVHPLATVVMQERGIDISIQSSKSLWALPWWSVDVVVTLSEEAEVCWRGLPGSGRHLYWPLLDPSRDGVGDERLEEFRALRDEVETRVRTLLSDLGLFRED
ncbi:MAG: arsenate reductase ArsC [Candidatus Rokubacteria bacterium]|nr:arsenate reductase ArsC [Candidatus Rokubacteria bacterium]